MPEFLGLKPVLFIPDRLPPFKALQFDNLRKYFGAWVHERENKIGNVGDDFIPIVVCRPGMGQMVREWRKEGRPFIYRDRGYAVRGGRTWLKLDETKGYHRWHLNCTQMTGIEDVPSDRWDNLRVNLDPWHEGLHIVIADTSESYDEFHDVKGWAKQTAAELRQYTDRPIKIREKKDAMSLRDDLKQAHCLVTHGSNAAVEAVIMGCPVFVDPVSAAAPMGLTDLSRIEDPIYPDREKWAASLAYRQFTDYEVHTGVMWDMVMAHGPDAVR